MTYRLKTNLLASLLTLTLALAVTAPANAQNRQYQRSQAAVSLQIDFGTTPHWVAVPGTRVREVRQGDRTDYDVFRYGRTYYAYNHENGRWYMSRRGRGEFRLIRDRYVPSELRRIPRNHWRNYPTAWEDREDQRSGGSSGTFQVTFGTRPHWSGISDTGVEIVPMAERPDYDVFRYGGMYYVYNSDRWYSSSRESGRFTAMDDRDVPREFSRVPSGQWRNYPTAWQDRNGQGVGGTSATFQVNFGTAPHWAGISGTAVEMVPVAERPNYDVFRYAGTYYVYNGNQWYSSPRESGQFAMIDDRAVPSELSRVPSGHWRNYPAGWGNQNGNGHSNGHGRGNRGN